MLKNIYGIYNRLPNIFLFLFAFTFPFGNYFFPIQTPVLLVNGFHLVLYSALAYLIINKKIKLFLGKSTKLYLIILCIWIIYGFCGLQAMEGARLTLGQLESVRRTLKKILKTRLKSVIFL